MNREGAHRRSFAKARQVVSVLAAERRAPELATRVRNEGLTRLRKDALADLHEAVQRVDRENVPGVLIEAGTARGGSAIVMAGAKRPERVLEVYDTFGLIPPPTDADGEDVHERYKVIESGKATDKDGRQYYGYVEDLKSVVAGSFAEMGYPLESNAITFHEGLFEDTLQPEGPVAVAHLDGDWYQSLIVCLERIEPVLSPGGVLVIDDYEAWSGAQRAVDDFLARPEVNLEPVWKSRLHLVKPR